MASATTQISQRQPITFHASWTDTNCHLQDSFMRKATRFTLGWINHIASQCILPAANKRPAEITRINEEFNTTWTNPPGLEDRFLAKQFTLQPLELTTPDNKKITGTFFKNAAATDSSPVVIFFQPNGTISKQDIFQWVMLQAALQEVPYNFIYFDYRGCAGSQDKAQSANGELPLDGDTVHQFARDHLHVPENDIHYYGWSLGGGAGVKTKALDIQKRGGRLVIERSFTSINDVVKNLSAQIVPFPVIHRVFAYAACFFLSVLNWNIDSAKTLPTLKGKTLIVHHPDDSMMKEEASLHRRLFERNAAQTPTNISHIDLSQGNRVSDADDAWIRGHIHGADLDFFNERSENFYPKQEIAQFLFDSPLPFNQRMIQVCNRASPDFRNKVYGKVAELFQSNNHYLGSGEDAWHRRNGFALTEAQMARAVMIAKLDIYTETT